MRVTFAASLLTLTLLASTPGRAAEATDTCSDFRVRAEREIVAAQSCSDAYFVRNNVREGDAVCFLAMTAKDSAADSLLALKVDKPAWDACMQDFKPLARTYVETAQWLLDVSKFRSDRHNNPKPKPLSVPLDAVGR